MDDRLQQTLPSWRNLLIWALLLAQVVLAEWESVLNYAYLQQNTLDAAKSQGADALIDGSFKTATVTDSTKSQYVKIQFTRTAKGLKSAFFANNAVDDNVVRTNGELKIAVSEHSGSAEKTCVTGILDTGFFKFETDCSDWDKNVRYVWLQQTTKPNGLDA